MVAESGTISGRWTHSIPTMRQVRSRLNRKPVELVLVETDLSSIEDRIIEVLKKKEEMDLANLTPTTKTL